MCECVYYVQGIKTPVRPGKGSKRKHPDTGSTPSRAEGNPRVQYTTRTHSN